MKAHLNSLKSTQTDLEVIGFQFLRDLETPILATYSPVPSLQNIANQHSAAIAASTGCAVSVNGAIGREIQWASTNLKSLNDSIEFHDNSVYESFGGTSIESNLSVNSQLTHNFTARPEFQVGQLTFKGVTLTTELNCEPETLLSYFRSTKDQLVFDAIDFWNTFGSTMTSISLDISALADRIDEDNTGEVFTAVFSQLKSLSERIRLVAESSTSMATSLSPLSEIRPMCVHQLETILERNRSMEDQAKRREISSAETSTFLREVYLPQLQLAVPSIQSLTRPLSHGLRTSITSTELPDVSQPTNLYRQIEAGSTYAASATLTPMISNDQILKSHSAVASSPHLTDQISSTSNAGTSTSTSVRNEFSSSSPRGRNMFLKSGDGSMTFRSPQPDTARRTVPMSNTGNTRERSHMQRAQNTTYLPNLNPSGTGNRELRADQKIRDPNPASNPTRSTPPHITNNGQQAINSSNAQASEKGRSSSSTGSRPGGTPSPVSSIAINKAKASESLIGKLARSRKHDLNNLNYRRLFGATEPTVPPTIGAELREV